MELADQELLRRTLRAILDRLETGGSPSAVVAEQPGAPPIVLVVLEQTASAKGGAKEAVERSQEGRAGVIAPTDSSINGSRSDMSHPGFAKFGDLEQRPAVAPKSCFMEPDRVCVDSGACEMLGH